MSSGETRRRSTCGQMGLEGKAVDVGVYAHERTIEKEERSSPPQIDRVDQTAEGDSKRRTHKPEDIRSMERAELSFDLARSKALTSNFISISFESQRRI